MIDYYLWGNCERISPEAPVQVVDIIKDTTILGGGGNVIHNLLAFGARVDIASVIGDDDSGNDLVRMLQGVGAGVGLLVRQPHRKTSKKTRIVAANQQVVRYDVESKEPISSESEKQLRDLLAGNIAQYDVVLISDYGKGVVTASLSQFIIHLAHRHGIRVLIDPKGADYSKYAGAYLITPNKKEAGIAARTFIKDQSSLEAAGFRLKQELQLEYAVITLSEDGIALFDTEMHLIPTRARDVFDVTGAGDTVLASLGFAIANKLNIEDACHFANYAAGVVVGKVGSATATLDEIEEYVSSFLKAGSHLFIRSSDNMAQIARRLRNNGKKIVLVEGVFDTVGPRQVRALEAAKGHGDVLLVAVCSDPTAKRGGEQPLHSQEDRSYLLAALKVVDYVVLSLEDPDTWLLNSLRPDVLVLNDAVREKEITEQGFEGKVLICPEVDEAIASPARAAK